MILFELLGFGVSLVWVQGGVVVVMSNGDSLDVYVCDIVVVGVGMVDLVVVQMVMNDVWEYILDLMVFGILFDWD